MNNKDYTLTFHGSAAWRSSIPVVVNAAREAGFDGVETNILQLGNYFDAGYTPADVKKAAGDMPIIAVGWLVDCERQGHQYVQMMKEAEELFANSSAIGAKSVQILSGPADFHAVESFEQGVPYQGYMALQGLKLEEQEHITAKNMKALGLLAQQFGLNLYFEPLCWCPVKSIRQGVKICEMTELDNVKMVIDFFHGHIAGDTPDEIAKLDPAVIDGVHVCDTMNADGVPNEGLIRNVKLGEGAVPVKEWVEAVKATGYTGRWCYESFYKKDWEEDPVVVAKQVYDMMTGLLA